MNTVAVVIWVAVLTSCALLLRALHRARPRSPGPAPLLHDLSEAAFLTGGPGAVVDAALVSLLGDGRMLAGGPGLVQPRPGARAADTAERAVLGALSRAPSGWLYQVRYAAMTDPAVQETGEALSARGLVSAPGWGRGIRRWGVAQAVVCAVLVPISLPLTFVAWALQPGSQVPFIVKVFPVLLGGVVFGSVCAKRAARRITPAGQDALDAFRTRNATDPSPHVRTALFGLRGVPDAALRAQLQSAARSTRLAAAQARGRRPHASSAAASSSDSCGSSGVGLVPVVWCAGVDGGGGGSGCGGSTGCGGSSGSGCSSGSSCSSGSGCSSGSSCSSSSSSCSSGSSCSSSSSSCGSSS
ncbi:TIGR04222 domain-containing membrane protein [Streptomyces sp. NPDC101733]|uniref:TIGR04222 domain-containing membrane protein n=1 Tax=unclassified Streptomyces TaxID=2593676 RepID=UPI003809D0B6